MNTSVQRVLFIFWHFAWVRKYSNLSQFTTAADKSISCGWNQSLCLFWHGPWARNGFCILKYFTCFKESIIFSGTLFCWHTAVLILRLLCRYNGRGGESPQTQWPAKLKIFTLWLCKSADSWCIRLAQRPPVLKFCHVGQREGEDVLGVLGNDVGRRDGKAFTPS